MIASRLDRTRDYCKGQESWHGHELDLDKALVLKKRKKGVMKKQKKEFLD